MNDLHDIVPFARTLPMANPYVQRGLVQAQERMQLVAEQAKTAMDEMSTVHTYAEYKLATTLTAVELIRATHAPARDPAPIEQAAYQRLQETYLQQMVQITQNADYRLVLQTASPPPAPEEREMRSIWEILAAWLTVWWTRR